MYWFIGWSKFCERKEIFSGEIETVVYQELDLRSAEMNWC
jgi:hypothetical protein